MLEELSLDTLFDEEELDWLASAVDVDEVEELD